MNSTELLTMLVWGEARGELFEGKCAVAEVPLNRTKSKGFPKDLNEVILQNRQFSCFDKATFIKKMLNPRKHGNEQEWIECATAVTRALSGSDYSNGATHYLRYDCYPPWRKNMDEVAKIGNHVFLKEKV